MAYCGPNGIPHSHFIDKWDPEDQSKAIGWVLDERSRCQKCGTVPSDWLDEEGLHRVPAPYVAVAELCLGCETVKERIEVFPEEQRYKYHVYLVPRGVAHGSISDRQDRPTG